MQNNQDNNNSHQFYLNNPLLLFNQTINNRQSEQPPQQTLRKKKTQFSNEIRHQQRDIYRQQMRRKHFNFISQMGIQQYNSNKNNIFQRIEQQIQKMIVQVKFNNQIRIQFLQYLEQQRLQDTDRIMKMIQYYKELNDIDYQRQLIEIWQEIMGRMKELYMIMRGSQQQHQQQNHIIEHYFAKDLRLLLQIMAREIFQPYTQQSRQLRLIVPGVMYLVENYVLVALSYKRLNLSNDELFMVEVILELLIRFSLKIQSFNFLDVHQVAKQDNWVSSCLFENLLTRFPFLYKKWSLLSQSTTFDVKVYGIFKVTQIIQSKLNEISNITNIKAQNLNSHLHQMNNLIDSLKQIIIQTRHMQFSWKSLSQRQSLQKICFYWNSIVYKSQHIIQQLIMLVRQNLWLLKQGLNFDMIYHIIINILTMARQFSLSSFSLMRKQQDQQQKTIDKINNQLWSKLIKQNSDIIEDKNHFMVVYIELQAKNTQQQSNKFINFYENYIVNKIQSNISLLQILQNMQQYLQQHQKQQQQHNKLNQIQHTLTSSNLNSNLRNNSKLTTTTINQLKYIIHNNILKQLQPQTSNRQCISQIEHILNRSEEIHSLRQIVKQDYNLTADKLSVQFLMVLLIKKYFLSVMELSGRLKQLNNSKERIENNQNNQNRQNNQNKQNRQKQKTLIICQIIVIVRTLNILSQKDKINIFKYGFIFNELINNSSKINQKNQCIFNHIQNIYSTVVLNKNNHSKSRKQTEIKSQLALLCENIAFSVFPLSVHFQEFSYQKDRSSKIGECIEVRDKFSNIMVRYFGNFIIERKYLQKNNNNIVFLFSDQYLDLHVDYLLNFILTLLNESIVELVISGIKILLMIIYCADDYDKSFIKYFTHLLKSSDHRIYLKIQNHLNQNYHDKVVELANQFFEELDKVTNDESFFTPIQGNNNSHERKNEHQNEQKDIQI